MRAFRFVYEEQLKGLTKESRDVLQVRSLDAKKPGTSLLSRIGGSTADVRTPTSVSMSPSRTSSFMSQSVADFSTSPSLSSSSQDSFRGLT